MKSAINIVDEVLQSLDEASDVGERVIFQDGEDDENKDEVEDQVKDEEKK